MYHRNIFGSSSKVFGNLRKSSDIFGNSRKMFGNVPLAFGTILENLRKSSEGGRKSSENHQKRRHQHVYIIKRTLHGGHSRPQRPRSFWSAPRIATSGLVQRHSVFEWLCEHNRLRPQPIRFVKLDSEHAQSDGKSVNRGLPVLDLARGRDSWC